MPQAVQIAEEPRGEDFTYKFRKGEWAESLLLKTLARHDDLVPIQYGVSRDDTLYTEGELDAVKEPNVTELKRPDILVFQESELNANPALDRSLLKRFHSANPDTRKELLETIEETGMINHAVMAIEAEASRFNLSERNPNYASLSAYVKSEDYPRLANWCLQYQDVPLFVCQLFFDSGHIIPFPAVERDADKHRQDGTLSTPGIIHDEIPGINKDGYHIKLNEYRFAFRFGDLEEEPDVVKEFDGERHEVEYTWSNGGQIISDVTDPHFHGGQFEPDAVETLGRFALDN